jgi:hypothetical protein
MSGALLHHGAMEPRSPFRQLLISALAPGLGSMGNGETRRGAVILIAWLGMIAVLIASAGQDPARPLTIVGFELGLFGIPALWIYNLVAAWRGANRHNLRRS